MTDWWCEKMSNLQKLVLCGLGILLAGGTFWLVWGHRPPGIEQLHKWYAGAAMTFIAIFAPAMFLALRGRLLTSGWPILVCGLVGWLAAAAAYIAYFMLLGDTKKTVATGLQMLSIALLLPPLATMSWLFGGLTGLFFVLLRRGSNRI